MSKNKKKVPKTKVKTGKKDLLKLAILNVVMYMEIEKDAKTILIRNKQLTPYLNMKLQLEMGFCANILKNLFKVSCAEVLRISDELRAEEDWAEEVDRFVDTVSPGSTKKIRVFNEGDFKNELLNQERAKKPGNVVKDMRVII